MLRRLICFVLANALLAGGLYWLYLQTFFARSIWFQGMEGAGYVATMGACWLWEDFIEPWLRGPAPPLTRPPRSRAASIDRWQADNDNDDCGVPRPMGARPSRKAQLVA